MAITVTWSIQDMTRDVSTGGVKQVVWRCDAVSSEGGESATDGGKLPLTPDTSDSGFIAYDDLTEAVVLDWVYDSLKEGDETADEAKARVAANRTGKVEAQIARKAADATGTPWGA
jgi:hypothetical protein